MNVTQMLSQVWNLVVEVLSQPLFRTTPLGLPSEEDVRLNFPHDVECHRNPYYDLPRMEDLGILWLDPPKLEQVYNFEVIDEEKSRLMGSFYAGGFFISVTKRYLKCTCCDKRVQIQAPTE